MAVRVTLRSRLPEITRTLQLRVSQDVKEGAEAILERSNADLDSRPTSGQSPATPHTSSTGAVEGGAGAYYVGYGGYWAHWVELGRKSAPPYPFLVPAAEAEAPNIAAKVTRTLQGL